MKRLVCTLISVLLFTALCSAAISNSKIRKDARFLTDKMAYELNLSQAQFYDVYEINYDFIANVSEVMDAALLGEEWALEDYYDFLDIRNDDLHYVLTNSQYSYFLRNADFYRPFYISSGSWFFRIYISYTNHSHFYFSQPRNYRTYSGGHFRTHHNNVSFYNGRYSHSPYNGAFRIRENNSYRTSRRSDFGSVNVRPNTSKNDGRKGKAPEVKWDNNKNNGNRIDTGNRNNGNNNNKNNSDNRNYNRNNSNQNNSNNRSLNQNSNKNNSDSRNNNRNNNYNKSNIDKNTNTQKAEGSNRNNNHSENSNVQSTGRSRISAGDKSTNNLRLNTDKKMEKVSGTTLTQSSEKSTVNKKSSEQVKTEKQSAAQKKSTNKKTKQTSTKKSSSTKSSSKKSTKK